MATIVDLGDDVVDGVVTIFDGVALGDVVGKGGAVSVVGGCDVFVVAALPAVLCGTGGATPLHDRYSHLQDCFGSVHARQLLSSMT